MYLIYTDESGNTGKNKADLNQPFHAIGALLVPDNKVRAIEDEVRRLCEKHFPDRCAEQKFELHGAELYSGEGPFKDVQPGTRIQAIVDLIDCLAAHTIKFGWTAANKPKLLTNNRHPHELAFVLLAENIELRLQEEDTLGLIIADENKEMEQKVIDDLELYKMTQTNFGWRRIQLNKIIDSVHFVQSHNNRLIQCADVLTYFTVKGYRERLAMKDLYRDAKAANKVAPFEAWVATNANRKQKTVLDLYDKIQGITVFDKVWPP